MGARGEERWAGVGAGRGRSEGRNKGRGRGGTVPRLGARGGPSGDAGEKADGEERKRVRDDHGEVGGVGRHGWRQGLITKERPAQVHSDSGDWTTCGDACGRAGWLVGGGPLAGRRPPAVRRGGRRAVGRWVGPAGACKVQAHRRRRVAGWPGASTLNTVCQAATDASRPRAHT